MRALVVVAYGRHSGRLLDVSLDASEPYTLGEQSGRNRRFYAPVLSVAWLWTGAMRNLSTVGAALVVKRVGRKGGVAGVVQGSRGPP